MLVKSNNGTVHAVISSYTTQSGTIAYRACKGVTGTVVQHGPITCKLCAKRVGQ